MSHELAALCPQPPGGTFPCSAGRVSEAAQRWLLLSLTNVCQSQETAAKPSLTCAVMQVTGFAPWVEPYIAQTWPKHREQPGEGAVFRNVEWRNNVESDFSVQIFLKMGINN